MVMPYGKFKGKCMHEIPSGYIRWLAKNCSDEKLCTAADREWRWRETHDAHFYEDRS